MFSKTSTIFAATLLTVASAHQNFHEFWVNDVSLGYEAAIRMPPSNSPVTDVTSNDITCNVNGNNVPSGKATQAANEGDTIKVKWDDSSHPGPITHYLFGPVANASMATGVGKWFKIDELDETDGVWANAIMQKNNMTHSFKLPTGLVSGDYLMRSEMLALHGAQTIGGAQFYIGCAQLTITGTGTGTDACGPSIDLPGAYNASDPSIYIPNVYNGFDLTTYTAPGGAVATCGAGSGSGSTPVTSSTPVSTSASNVSASASSVEVEATQAPAATTAEAPLDTPSASVAATALETAATSAPATSIEAPSASTAPSSTEVPVATEPTVTEPAVSVQLPSTTAVPTTLQTIVAPAPSAPAGGNSTTGSAVPRYGQCGGINYTGSTSCAAGTCTVQNPYYSQCV